MNHLMLDQHAIIPAAVRRMRALTATDWHLRALATGSTTQRLAVRDWIAAMPEGESA